MSITVFINTMPRYRRRYTNTIVRAPKKRWNLGYMFANTDPAISSTSFVNFSTIVQNDTDNANPTPTVIKARRIQVFGCLTVQAQVQQQTTPQPVMWTSFVIFIPQIVYRSIPNEAGLQSGFIQQTLIDHPEWVMSKKNLQITWNGGQPSESVSYKWTQSTGNLSRNLKSGDRILWILVTKPLLPESTTHWQQCSLEFNFATCPS